MGKSGAPPVSLGCPGPWVGHRSPGPLLCEGLAGQGFLPWAQAPAPPELHLQLTLHLHTELWALNVFLNIPIKILSSSKPVTLWKRFLVEAPGVLAALSSKVKMLIQGTQGKNEVKRLGALATQALEMLR